MRRTASRLLAGPGVYPEADLQYLDVHMRLGQQPLEPVIPRLQLLKSLDVFGLHAAALGSPGVDAGGAKTVLSGQQDGVTNSRNNRLGVAMEFPDRTDRIRLRS